MPARERKLSYLHQYRKPSAMERIVAAGSYIFPLLGFIFIIITALMKKEMKPFLKYHIFQSIFIAFALWILLSGLGFAMHLLSYIPGIKTVVSMITFFLNMPLFLGFSVVTLVYFLFVLYLVVGALRGSDSFVPWVSNIIKANLRGQY